MAQLSPNPELRLPVPVAVKPEPIEDDTTVGQTAEFETVFVQGAPVADKSGALHSTDIPGVPSGEDQGVVVKEEPDNESYAIMDVEYQSSESKEEHCFLNTPGGGQCLLRACRAAEERKAFTVVKSEHLELLSHPCSPAESDDEPLECSGGPTGEMEPACPEYEPVRSDMVTVKMEVDSENWQPPDTKVSQDARSRADTAEEGQPSIHGRGRGSCVGDRVTSAAEAAGPNTCAFCSKTFRFASRLKKHLVTHTGERPFPCGQCGKAFTERVGLRNHEVAIHGLQKPFTCEHCCRRYATEAALHQHQKAGGRQHAAHAAEGGMESEVPCRGSQGQSDPLSCPDCGREFATTTTLRRHQLQHTGERPFLCELCGRGFTVKRVLQAHMRGHRGERPFVCEVCGTGFTAKHVLVDHMRTHTGERPFVCTLCNKSFTVRKILRDHLRTHAGERPYVCEVCGKSFSDSSHLAPHRRIHTGERPFACPHCPAAFAQNGNLKQHLLVHEQQRPYPCADCSVRFTTVSRMRRHRTLVHGAQPAGADAARTPATAAASASASPQSLSCQPTDSSSPLTQPSDSSS